MLAIKPTNTLSLSTNYKNAQPAKSYAPLIEQAGDTFVTAAKIQHPSKLRRMLAAGLIGVATVFGSTSCTAPLGPTKPCVPQIIDNPMPTKAVSEKLLKWAKVLNPTAASQMENISAYGFGIEGHGCLWFFKDIKPVSDTEARGSYVFAMESPDGPYNEAERTIAASWSLDGDSIIQKGSIDPSSYSRYTIGTDCVREDSICSKTGKILESYLLKPSPDKAGEVLRKSLDDTEVLDKFLIKFNDEALNWTHSVAKSIVKTAIH